MNFLNDSIPRAQGGCLSPQLCTKLGHCPPHPLPKLQRLTHASWEDLLPIQDQAASQEMSGLLPAPLAGWAQPLPPAFTFFSHQQSEVA